MARPLGERALGRPDPGAVSLWLMLDLMRANVADAPA